MPPSWMPTQPWRHHARHGPKQRHRAVDSVGLMVTQCGPNSTSSFASVIPQMRGLRQNPGQMRQSTVTRSPPQKSEYNNTTRSRQSSTMPSMHRRVTVKLAGLEAARART